MPPIFLRNIILYIKLTFQAFKSILTQHIFTLLPILSWILPPFTFMNPQVLKIYDVNKNAVLCKLCAWQYYSLGTNNYKPN